VHFIAVLNRDGGTFRTMNLDVLREQATRIFKQHGHSLDCRIVPGRDVVGALRAAAGEKPDVLIAGGGDGTVSAAAGMAFHAQVALAVLPAGTMNLFARTLGIPLDLHLALEAIAEGEIEAVDVASANGKVFVHQFAVGIHARLVRIRETLTYKSRLGKILASWRAALTVLFRPPRFVAEIRAGGTRELRETSGISITNNPVGEGHIPYADGLNRGLLGVYVTEPLSGWQLGQLAAALLLGRWKASPLVTERAVEKLTLHFPKRKRTAHAVIDGELIRLAGEIELRVHPGALMVVRPAAPVRSATIAA